MSATDVFKYTNFAASGLIAVGALTQFGLSIASLVRVTFGLVAAAAIAYLEIRVPPEAARYASFLVSFEGRGAFYVLMGGLLLEGSLFKYIIGLILVSIGAVYIGLGVTHRVEAPDSMRLEPELPIDTI